MTVYRASHCNLTDGWPGDFVIGYFQSRDAAERASENFTLPGGSPAWRIEEIKVYARVDEWEEDRNAH